MFLRKGGGGGGKGTIFKPENYFIFNSPKKKKNLHTLFDLSRNFITWKWTRWHVTVSLCFITKNYQNQLIIASLPLNTKIFRTALQIIMACYDLIPSILTNMIKSISTLSLSISYWRQPSLVLGAKKKLWKTSVDKDVKIEIYDEAWCCHFVTIAGYQTVAVLSLLVLHYEGFEFSGYTIHSLKFWHFNLCKYHYAAEKKRS